MKPSRELQKEWYGKLKESGFEDCEDLNRRLISDGHKTTINWKEQEQIRDFFFHAGRYLNENKIPLCDKLVLDRWIEGMYFPKIAEETGFSIITCKRIVTKHKKLILEWVDKGDENDEDF